MGISACFMKNFRNHIPEKTRKHAEIPFLHSFDVGKDAIYTRTKWMTENKSTPVVLKYVTFNYAS